MTLFGALATMLALGGDRRTERMRAGRITTLQVRGKSIRLNHGLKVDFSLVSRAQDVEKFRESFLFFREACVSLDICMASLIDELSASFWLP